MTEHIERRYTCDLTGKEIDNLWQMLTVTLDAGKPKGWTIPSSTDETIHISGDSHPINHEPENATVTALITDETQIIGFKIDRPSREWYEPRDGEWSDLAEQIECEVLDK